MKTLFKCLLLLAIGALTGPIVDGFHSQSGTLGYPEKLHPFFNMLWFSPLFGMATLLIAISHVMNDKLLGRPNIFLSWVKVLVGLIIFTGIYYISGYWYVDSVTKSLTLAVLAIAFWYVFDRTWQGGTQAILTAACGCAFESFIIQQSVFYYSAPDLLGIPYWLFFLYIPAGISIGNLGRKLFLK